MVNYDSGYITVRVKIVNGERFLLITIFDDDQEIETSAILDMESVHSLVDVLLNATLDKPTLN